MITDTQKQQLGETVKNLLARGKGILAADESRKTLARRFTQYAIEDTEENRRKWRGLLFATSGIERDLSGVILFDETIRQTTKSGVPFPEFLAKRGIIPGIKVDGGTVAMPNFPEETVTAGLDGLADRLTEYAKLGAKFTKWRATIRILPEKHLPTAECIEANAYLCAQFAALSQNAGFVPIVEPEVLLDGAHDIDQCVAALKRTIQTVFVSLMRYRVYFPGVILKSSMALAGKDSGFKTAPKEVAVRTLEALRFSVPPDVPGIVFLSGGQTPEEAMKNLAFIVKAKTKKDPAWRLTFSYSRALQEPVMAAWSGADKNVKKAQAVFAKRVEETARASEGAL